MDSTSVRRLALQKFDQANQEDPRHLEWKGSFYPQEYFYAMKLSEWVEKLDPNPSEALRLASRCQHLQRWKIPRDSYPQGRAGYLLWRKNLAQFHADSAATILKELGCSPQLIAQVQAINLKRELKTNADAQTIEDGLCLVFLEYQFEDFLSKTPPEKVQEVLQKTWRKMSDRGRRFALEISFSERGKEAVTRALAEARTGSSCE